MRCDLLGVFGQPPFPRRPFTVLFDMPVLRHEVLRRQGNDLRLSRADDHRRDGGMIIESLAITELTAETVLVLWYFPECRIAVISTSCSPFAQSTPHILNF